MSTVQECLDMLRGRLARLKQGRPYDVLQHEVGVSHITLKAFARGQAINLGSVTKIEEWCAREEQRGTPYAQR